MSLHLPIQPTWTCASCGDPWPCATRRSQLRAEFAGTRVCMSIYLTLCLVDAIRDLPHYPAGLLYTRFLGWVRD